MSIFTRLLKINLSKKNWNIGVLVDIGKFTQSAFTYSKLTINFEHISHFALVFLLFTLNM